MAYSGSDPDMKKAERSRIKQIQRHENPSLWRRLCWDITTPFWAEGIRRMALVSTCVLSLVVIVRIFINCNILMCVVFIVTVSMWLIYILLLLVPPILRKLARADRTLWEVIVELFAPIVEYVKAGFRE
jgi:hypothetical protein